MSEPSQARIDRRLRSAHAVERRQGLYELGGVLMRFGLGAWATATTCGG